MFSHEQVGTTVVWSGLHQGTRVFPTCCYMPHGHRVSVVLYSYHGPIWGLVKGESFYLTPSLHGVSCAAHKMVIQETGLLHTTFSLMRVVHFFCLKSDTYSNSTLVYWAVFFPYLDITLHVYGLGLKDFFEITLQG